MLHKTRKATKALCLTKRLGGYSSYHSKAECAGGGHSHQWEVNFALLAKPDGRNGMAELALLTAMMIIGLDKYIGWVIQSQREANILMHNKVREAAKGVWAAESYGEG